MSRDASAEGFGRTIKKLTKAIGLREGQLEKDIPVPNCSLTRKASRPKPRPTGSGPVTEPPKGVVAPGPMADGGGICVSVPAAVAKDAGLIADIQMRVL